MKKAGTKLVTIISASNRPHNMRDFLQMLADTVDDPKSIEVLVKIDDGDQAMRALMDEAVKRHPYEIRFIQTPRDDGYYTLHHAYQYLLEMSDPSTYFIFPVNDEVRFVTKGWDTILRGYVGLYDDDLFRLKMSRLKYRNYYSFHDCGPCPENYPFFTRRWMELVEGIGDCWGPDGWHQFIDYHLGQTPGIAGIPGIFRSVPILDINLSGEEAGKELTGEQARSRGNRINQEWWRMFSPKLQQTFRRLATKINAYMWARDKGLKDFYVVEYPERCLFVVYGKAEDGTLGTFPYYLSPWFVRWQNFGHLLRESRLCHLSVLKAYVVRSDESPVLPLRWLGRIERFFVAVAAYVLSWVLPYAESKHPNPVKNYLLRLYALCMQLLRRFIPGQKANAGQHVAPSGLFLRLLRLLHRTPLELNPNKLPPGAEMTMHFHEEAMQPAQAPKQAA